MGICTLFNTVYFGLSPLPVTVEMKVYRDSLLKGKCNNPGGDWNAGRGDNSMFICLFLLPVVYCFGFIYPP